MPKVLAFNRDRRRRRGTAEGDALHGAQAVPAAQGAPRSASVTRLHPGPDGALAAVADIDVSIVVPTRGRPQLLNRCLASLVLQRFDPGRFEIIVVDDGPDDDTRSIVVGWSAHTAGTGPDIVYIPSRGPHGPAAARNHGWQVARGDIIAFTDDDTIARADWLVHGMRAFNDDVHAVRGRIVMPLSGVPTDYQLDAKNLENAEFVTANCFVRKRVLEDIGGFDERFRFAWREDSDLYFRLLEYSAGIAHAPNAVMTHPIRPAGWGVSLKQLKKIQFDALLFKKHPQLYRQKIRARPRWDFYLTVAALFVLLAGLVAELAEAAVAAGLVWLFMTGRFCAQRLRRTSKSPAHIAEMLVTSILIPPLAVFWRAVGALKFRAGLI
ncbi:MAG TPA: glycosyltransferase family A protein [Noviherbaspirillum sp.]|nr:glycosyltransferase family A protein [Noviherbaspirillum sp.]